MLQPTRRVMPAPLDSGYRDPPVPPFRRPRARTLQTAAGIAVYFILSLAYTWPLARHLTSLLPSDPADPVFNTAILRWNATTLPFSDAWWNAPHYFPTTSVAAFTENLVGVSVVATPAFWLTSSPIAAYNIAYFLTWPLSAIAVFLLVRALTNRFDAGFLAGLVFAFTPYRTAEIAHVQSLSAYWLPIALLGAHGYLTEGRRSWLWLFGGAWLLQSFSNGHYMLFGGVVVGLWIAYFCSTTGRWRAGAAILVTWIAVSLPLLPVLLKYSAVHVQYGLKRDLNEILAYSARLHSWFEVTGDAWFWRTQLPLGKDALFPGITGLACATAGALALVWRGRSREARSLPSRLAWAAVMLIGLVAFAALAAGLTVGPWSVRMAGIVVRMADLNRAVAGVILAAVVLVGATPVLRRALGRRSPFVFYSMMTVVIAVLCFGPVIHTGETVMLSPAPYRWLMALPGFDELRVPVRFWMLGVMCLSVAAGLGYSSLVGTRSAWRLPLLVVVSLAALSDGWMPTLRLAVPPGTISLEASGERFPILELPLGPDWDWDATYRAAGHRRRVVNGISGYDPPHYDALRVGLAQRDPGILSALASLGTYEVVLNTSADPDGAIDRYVRATPGVRLIAEELNHRLFRVLVNPDPTRLGAALPIQSVRAVRARELFDPPGGDAVVLHDSNIDTGWDDYPQESGQWIRIDLGAPVEVAGLTHVIGRSSLAFPRRLVIESSVDGQSWQPAWEGPATPAAMLALIREPLRGAMQFGFAPRTARYVRLLQTGRADRQWHVADLMVHAPPG